MNKKLLAEREALRKARKKESGFVRLEFWVKKELKPKAKIAIEDLLKELEEYNG